MLRKRFLFVTFMFLLGLLVPAGWLAALPVLALPSAPLSQPDTPYTSFLGPWCIDAVRSKTTNINPLTDSLPGKSKADTIPLTGTTTIGGLMWYDLNGNGIQDNGEPGVDEVQCVLCRFGENVPVATTRTDARGQYRFQLTDTLSMATSDLYYVVFQQPDGYRFAAADVDANDHDDQDSDVISSTTPNTGRTDYFTLSAATNKSRDAGLISEEYLLYLPLVRNGN